MFITLVINMLVFYINFIIKVVVCSVLVDIKLVFVCAVRLLLNLQFSIYCVVKFIDCH